LFAAAGLERPAGKVEMLPAPTPFGAAVTVSGTHIYDLAFVLRDLPDPASLGPYTTYVAWAMPPVLDPVIKLGVVRNGRVLTGRVALDQFLIMITAEASPAVTQRSTRLVLRGTSPSMRLQPDDMAFVLAGMLEKANATHLHAATDSMSWTPPPMHPRMTAPAGLMLLRPDVSPYRLNAVNAPPARPREFVRLNDGAELTLVAAPVRRTILGRTHTMLGFNGQYPGPLVHVEEGSTITIHFQNSTDFPTAIHWHGVRLDNRFDGVPHVTQEPVAPGATFTYRVHFPDAGIFWYHPHHREDVLQDLGLYGNLLVRARDAAFFGPAHRDEILMLDDLLIAESGLVPWGSDAPTHALMGRFGNVLLVNGEPRWNAVARHGEVVRFFLTNVSSTRVFNLSFVGNARMKVVASDIGRYAREVWVENVVIAPAERYVVDVLFDSPGDVHLLNRVRAVDHLFGRFFPDTDTLGIVRVSAEGAQPDHAAAFANLRTNTAVAAEITALSASFERPPDHTLLVTLQTRDLPFPLLPLLSFESVWRNPVEWSGTMPEMDWAATGRHANWILRDVATGRDNLDIAWRFRTGDLVKLRLVSDRNAVHAMQHPIHIHGQRFLVLSVNGVPNPYPVWKDTVLLPTGFVVDILMQATNPGKWMMHCHVAEHIESGMKLLFDVEN
jgi:FtsP/CotA-like multicopper oxidase with cupredoxin domain